MQAARGRSRTSRHDRANRATGAVEEPVAAMTTPRLPLHEYLHRGSAATGNSPWPSSSLVTATIGYRRTRRALGPPARPAARARRAARRSRRHLPAQVDRHGRRDLRHPQGRRRVRAGRSHRAAGAQRLHPAQLRGERRRHRGAVRGEVSRGAQRARAVASDARRRPTRRRGRACARRSIGSMAGQPAAARRDGRSRPRAPTSPTSSTPPARPASPRA